MATGIRQETIYEIKQEAIYSEEETRAFLGGIGRSKFSEYMKLGLITPIRRRPSMFTGLEILNSMERITEFNRQSRKSAVDPSSYGIE